MRISGKVGTAAIALIAAAALGGAQALALERPMIAVIAPGDERIVFAAEEFEGTTPRRVRYTDVWEREEYALFQGNGAQAEIIYSAAKTDEAMIALAYNLVIARMVKTWNLNRNNVEAWGGKGEVSTPFGLFFYRRYKLARRNRVCFGFSGEWDEPSDDPQQRPGKVLFGYFCAKEGADLPYDRIEDLILRLGIRGITERLPRRRQGDKGSADRLASTSAEAEMIARGSSPSAETGNPNVPFTFAVPYMDTTGDGSTKGH